MNTLDTPDSPPAADTLCLGTDPPKSPGAAALESPHARKSILVVGHRNPDTDSCVSAWAYARFLNQSQRYTQLATALIPGEPTPQARYVFERAGVQLPPSIDSLRPRVADVANYDFKFLHQSDRLRTAIEALTRHDVSMLPVLTDDGSLYGVFSNRAELGRLLLGFNVAPLLSTLMTWGDLANMPGMYSLGAAPDHERLDGTLHVAILGERGWPQQADPDDVVVFGRLPDWTAISGSIRRIIVLGEENLRAENGFSEDSLRLANQQGIHLLVYTRPLNQLFCDLNLQVRLEKLHLPEVTCVGERDSLEDVRSIIRSNRLATPVVNNDGQVVATVSRTDLNAAPKPRVVLVDHFAKSQTVPGMEHAEILEVIDHHHVGNLETTVPIRIDCRPVGSTATIVTLNYLENEHNLDPPTATLLLGGLIADTLCLRGPTTTPIDVQVARTLAQHAQLDLEPFGREVLAAADDLQTSDPTTIWNRDQKHFSIRNHQFSIAQLESVNLPNLTQDQLETFQACVAADLRRGDQVLSCLFLTDVLSNESWLAYAEAESFAGTVETAFGRQYVREAWLRVPGVVSRKLQMLPGLLAALASRTAD